MLAVAVLELVSDAGLKTVPHVPAVEHGAVVMVVVPGLREVVRQLGYKVQLNPVIDIIVDFNRVACRDVVGMGGSDVIIVALERINETVCPADSGNSNKLNLPGHPIITAEQIRQVKLRVGQYINVIEPVPALEHTVARAVLPHYLTFDADTENGCDVLGKAKRGCGLNRMSEVLVTVATGMSECGNATAYADLPIIGKLRMLNGLCASTKAENDGKSHRK